MILALHVTWRAGLLQVLILSIFFWRVVSQQLLAFREFQKSSKKKKAEELNMCDEVKIQEENEQKRFQT